MHEESIAYWSKAVSRSEQDHCGRRLVLEVAADGDAPQAAARCQIPSTINSRRSQEYVTSTKTYQVR